MLLQVKTVELSSFNKPIKKYKVRAKVAPLLYTWEWEWVSVRPLDAELSLDKRETLSEKAESLSGLSVRWTAPVWLVSDMLRRWLKSGGPAQTSH